TLPVASLLLYFFSSRRRHTRFSRDWSSDVCSSDLVIFYTHLWRIASRVEAGMFQLRGRANDFHDSSIQVKIWCTVSNQLIGNQVICLIHTGAVYAVVYLYRAAGTDHVCNVKLVYNSRIAGTPTCAVKQPGAALRVNRNVRTFFKYIVVEFFCAAGQIYVVISDLKLAVLFMSGDRRSQFKHFSIRVKRHLARLESLISQDLCKTAAAERPDILHIDHIARRRTFYKKKLDVKFLLIFAAQFDRHSFFARQNWRI